MVVSLADVRSAATGRGVTLRESPSGLLIVPLEELIALVDVLEELHLVILGCDGLVEDDDGHVTHLELIADWSGIVGSRAERVRLSAAETRLLAATWITHGGPDLVEVTVDGADPSLRSRRLPPQGR